MNIGWAGAVFLWVILLWPVILAGAYLVWKKDVLTRKGRFFVVSVAVGYVALFVANLLSGAILSQFPEVTGGPGTSQNPELLNIMALIAMAILFILPALSAFYIAKRFSR